MLQLNLVKESWCRECHSVRVMLLFFHSNNHCRDRAIVTLWQQPNAADVRDRNKTLHTHTHIYSETFPINTVGVHTWLSVAWHFTLQCTERTNTLSSVCSSSAEWRRTAEWVYSVPPRPSLPSLTVLIYYGMGLPWRHLYSLQLICPRLSSSDRAAEYEWLCEFWDSYLKKRKKFAYYLPSYMEKHLICDEKKGYFSD